MKILIYGLNYHPEVTATGKYTTEMAEWLVRDGKNEVDVITGMPFYPQWEISEEYKKKAWIQEKINGVRVFRCPLYVPQDGGTLKRILHETSFSVSSLFWWVSRLFVKYDLVIAICPPFQTGLLPLVYSKLKSTPWLYHIQDLQLDMAKSLNLIKNKKALNLLEQIETYLLEKATYVSSISEGMKGKILHKIRNKNKYIELPNWVNTDFLMPADSADYLKKIINNISPNKIKKDTKIVLYSGNLGEKQGLENLLEVAFELRNNGQLYFVVCGDGVAKKRLMKQHEDLELQNLCFLPLQPYKHLPDFLNSADIHLVLQKKNTSNLVLPSKLTGILSVGGLVIITTDKGSFLENIINQFDMGICIEPENNTALSETLTAVSIGTFDSRSKQCNARQYALTYLNQNSILGNFTNYFNK
jgi:colanic acid biosynthesis glycosyl transferase WcaI